MPQEILSGLVSEAYSLLRAKTASAGLEGMSGKDITAGGMDGEEDEEEDATMEKWYIDDIDDGRKRDVC